MADVRWGETSIYRKVDESGAIPLKSNGSRIRVNMTGERVLEY
jgi:hypothetical protein